MSAAQRLTLKKNRQTCGAQRRTDARRLVALLDENNKYVNIAVACHPLLLARPILRLLRQPYLEPKISPCVSHDFQLLSEKLRNVSKYVSVLHLWRPFYRQAKLASGAFSSWYFPQELANTAPNER